jgi:hypothetical protein
MDREEVRTDDIQTVHVWVCILRGTLNQIEIRATEDRAVNWIESNLSDDGEWTENTDGVKRTYQPEDGPDSGSIELCGIPDAVGMVVED